MEAATLTPIAGDQATDIEPIVLTAKQASEMLACSISQIYALVKSGQLPAVKLGKSGIRIPKAQLVAWINGGGVEEEDFAKKRALILAASRR